MRIPGTKQVFSKCYIPSNPHLCFGPVQQTTFIPQSTLCSISHVLAPGLLSGTRQKEQKPYRQEPSCLPLLFFPLPLSLPLLLPLLIVSLLSILFIFFYEHHAATKPVVLVSLLLLSPSPAETQYSSTIRAKQSLCLGSASTPFAHVSSWQGQAGVGQGQGILDKIPSFSLLSGQILCL